MIHTPPLLLISLAINLMSGLIMLFIHSLKPGRGNFLYWSLSAFLFSLSILLLSLGVLGGYPALGIRVGGLVSLMSILLLLAGFCALYERAWHPRAVGGGVAVLLLLYLGLSSLAPVRIVLALMESMLYLWCACLIVSLGRQQKRVLHAVALIYLLHFTILLSQGGLLLLGVEGRMGGGGWLDLIFFMHMVLTIGSVLLLPLVAYVETEEALLALSERDPLTGVLNRRGLFRQREGATPGQTRCVVVLDIDHFKRVNDQFGHGCGDEVIRYVAGVLVARYARMIWWGASVARSSPSSWGA
ncbi:GGDEF domain-containing protein [Aeromonas caviae]